MVPNATNKPTVARSSGPRPAGAIGMVNRARVRETQSDLSDGRWLRRSASCDFDEDEGEGLGSGHT